MHKLLTTALMCLALLGCGEDSALDGEDIALDGEDIAMDSQDIAMKDSGLVEISSAGEPAIVFHWQDEAYYQVRCTDTIRIDVTNLSDDSLHVTGMALNEVLLGQDLSQSGISGVLYLSLVPVDSSVYPQEVRKDDTEVFELSLCATWSAWRNLDLDADGNSWHEEAETAEFLAKIGVEGYWDNSLASLSELGAGTVYLEGVASGQ